MADADAVREGTKTERVQRKIGRTFPTYTENQHTQLIKGNENKETMYTNCV